MPKNIKKIELWKNNPQQRNKVPLVKIDFEFPCEWTVLNIEDLKLILRLWIEGEENAYSQGDGFRGRWLLFDEIKKVFDENPPKTARNPDVLAKKEGFS